MKIALEIPEQQSVSKTVSQFKAGDILRQSDGPLYLLRTNNGAVPIASGSPGGASLFHGPAEDFKSLYVKVGELEVKIV